MFGFRRPSNYYLKLTNRDLDEKDIIRTWSRSAASLCGLSGAIALFTVRDLHAHHGLYAGIYLTVASIAIVVSPFIGKMQKDAERDKAIGAKLQGWFKSQESMLIHQADELQMHKGIFGTERSRVRMKRSFSWPRFAID